jgi:hypothetical protein
MSCSDLKLYIGTALLHGTRNFNALIDSKKEWNLSPIFNEQKHQSRPTHLYSSHIIMVNKNVSNFCFNQNLSITFAFGIITVGSAVVVGTAFYVMRLRFASQWLVFFWHSTLHFNSFTTFSYIVDDGTSLYLAMILAKTTYRSCSAKRRPAHMRVPCPKGVSRKGCSSVCWPPLNHLHRPRIKVTVRVGTKTFFHLWGKNENCSEISSAKGFCGMFSQKPKLDENRKKYLNESKNSTFQEHACLVRQIFSRLWKQNRLYE